MEITFWGTRGSIAAPGPDTMRYGGNTACVSVAPEEGPLLILDAGTGIRALGKHLLGGSQRSLTLILTHSHWDHIQGFPFFTPAYDKAYQIQVLGYCANSQFLPQALTVQMQRPFFPIPLKGLNARIEFGEFSLEWTQIGTARLQAIPLRHPGGGGGVRVEEASRALVYLTDNELPGAGLDWDFYVEACRGADLLIHDAQYRDDEMPAHLGWGHSSSEQATRLALEAGCKRLALFHHDPERADSEIDAMVDACRAQAAGQALEIFAAAEGQTVHI